MTTAPFDTMSRQAVFNDRLKPPTKGRRTTTAFIACLFVRMYSSPGRKMEKICQVPKYNHSKKKKKRLSVWPCPPPSTAGIGSSSPRPWIKYKLVKDGWVANVHTIALNSINRSLIAPQYHLQGWKVSYVLALYTLLLSIMYNILYIIYYI